MSFARLIQNCIERPQDLLIGVAISLLIGAWGLSGRRQQ